MIPFASNSLQHSHLANINCLRPVLNHIAYFDINWLDSQDLVVSEAHNELP